MTLYHDVAGVQVDTVIPILNNTKGGLFDQKIRSFLDAIATTVRHRFRRLRSCTTRRSSMVSTSPTRAVTKSKSNLLTDCRDKRAYPFDRRTTKDPRESQKLTGILLWKMVCAVTAHHRYGESPGSGHFLNVMDVFEGGEASMISPWDLYFFSSADWMVRETEYTLNPELR